MADAKVSSLEDTELKSVSMLVIAVPLVKVRLSIVALVASSVATDDIPLAILTLEVIKSGNLSSLIVPVVILAPFAKFVAVVAVPVTSPVTLPVSVAVIVPALKSPDPSRATSVDAVLASVALLVTVNV